MSPHVAREPRPVGDGGGGPGVGGSGVVGLGGRQNPTPSVSGAPRPVSACGDMLAGGSPPPAIATRASHSLIPTTSVVSRPGPLPGGSRGAGGVTGARAVLGRHTGRARVCLHVAARGQPLGPPPTPFPGWWHHTCGKHLVGPPFGQAQAPGGGRTQNSDGSDRVEQEGEK